MTVQTSETHITPKTAAAMLERNLDNNRRVQQKKVMQYARAMKEDRWLLNGASLKLDREGNLLDGQHRLWACIEAGVPFSTMITTGLDPDTFSTIDTGVQRTLGVVLGIAGVASGHTTAAAVRWACAIKAGQVYARSGIGNYRMMPDEVLAAYNAMPGFSDSVAFAQNLNSVTGFRSLMAALHWLFMQAEPEEATRFFEDLKLGIGLDVNDPVWRLRERLAQRINRRLRDQEACLLTVRAWNARLEGRSLNKITLVHGYSTNTLQKPPRANKKDISPDERLNVEPLMPKHSSIA